MKVIKPVDTGVYCTLTRASTATYWNSAGTLQTAAINALRVGYTRDGQFLGALIEPLATNLLWPNTTLGTQTRTVLNATTYTLSFYGTGTVTLSGAATGATVGTGANTRTTRTFTTTSTSLTLTVSGSVTYAQLETGSYATSVIVTTSGSLTRSADVVSGTGVLVSDFADATASYAGGTTYALGAVVRYNTRLYESLQAGNTGHQPDSSPTWWLDTGADNTYAMFDRASTKQSTGSATTCVVCVVMPSDVGAAGLMNLANTTSAALVVSDGYGNFYRATKTGSPVDVALMAGGVGTVVSVLVKNTGAAYPAVGELVIGTQHDLGDTRYGLGMSLMDFSRKERDDFGNYSFTERAFSKRQSASVLIGKASLNDTLALLFSVRAKPTVWLATDIAEFATPALVYGFLRDLSLSIDYPTEAVYRLEIEGLT